jgi:hypothetical protein
MPTLAQSAAYRNFANIAARARVFDFVDFLSADDIADQIAEDEAAVLSTIERCGSVSSAFEMPGAHYDFFEEFGQAGGQQTQMLARGEVGQRGSAPDYSAHVELPVARPTVFLEEPEPPVVPKPVHDRHSLPSAYRVRLFMNRRLLKWRVGWEAFHDAKIVTPGQLTLLGRGGQLVMTRVPGDPDFWKSYRRSVESLRRHFKKAS